jgi:acetyltransferase-like isoleucine patch superfamily enzyme
MDVARPNRRAPDKKNLLRRLALTIRLYVLWMRTVYLRSLGMDIHPDTKVSFKANLDRTNPRGVHIAQGTVVAFGAVILTHDLSRVLHADTYIGENCFIGAHSIILPGIRIGDGSIIAAGSVVTRDVKPRSIVAGNPARIVRTGIVTQKWGILEESYREALLAQSGSDAEVRLVKTRKSEDFDR